MGGIGGMLGLNGGAGGTGFAGPNQADVINPVANGQVETAYTGNQNALAQQQALLQALQAQNGLQNQSNVYNQLQGVASGTGPNPAQAMLNQATGANVAQQAALMAGQRGSSANPALIARQAAMQGANLQQQAIGQGATMQAQQALNALNSAGNLATTQAGQQIQGTQANTQAQQGEQAQLLNALQGVNQARTSSQSSVNAGNAALAGTTMQGQQGMIGGVLNGAGAALGLAKGGVVPRYAAGTTDIGADMSKPLEQTIKASTPQSSFGKILSAAASSMPETGSNANYGNPGANQLSQGMSNFTKNLFKSSPQQPTIMAGEPSALPNGEMYAAKGGKVPAMVSPGEKYLKPSDVKEVAKGKNPMKVGEKIPGKPKVPGAKDSYANDTVPKTLEAGGIVLPRSVTQAKNAPEKAAEFVRAVMAKNRKGLK